MKENKVYLRFNDPISKEPICKEGAFKELLKEIVIRVISVFFPKANPDYDNLIENVEYWKIEYDKSKNWTCREIGYDKNGVSIVAMPLKDNYGFWGDSNLTLKDYEEFGPNKSTFEEFNDDWILFENRNK